MAYLGGGIVQAIHGLHPALWRGASWRCPLRLLPSQSNGSLLRSSPFSNPPPPPHKKATARVAFFVWWRRGESNPRPKVLRPRIYMLSALFDLILRQHNVQGAPQNQPVKS
jgi:hypothetical protein